MAAEGSGSFPATAAAALTEVQVASPTTTTTTSSSSRAAPVVAASPETMPVIAFPGGGIYFYWQAGAVHYLQQHFDLSKARLVGASAGALTAALAGCGVDMPYAAEVALKMSMNVSE